MLTVNPVCHFYAVCKFTKKFLLRNFKNSLLIFKPRLSEFKKMQNSCIPGIPVRVVIAILMFGGTFVSYVLRVNLNLAIVTMTNNSEVLCVNKSTSDR
jgi:hypothetical protein